LPATATDLVREPTIDYFRKPPVDSVALLRQQIDNGTAALTYEPEQGYLRSVMRALHLEADSQVLVYSKTSVQAVRINPKNPRGIYFGDAVTLGYIRGADYLEFAAQDPRQGTIFYTLDQRPSDRPLIQRRDSACRATSAWRRSKCRAAGPQHPHLADRRTRLSLATRWSITVRHLPSGGAATTSPAVMVRSSIWVMRWSIATTRRRRTRRRKT
jgi:hypothetical protein